MGRSTQIGASRLAPRSRFAYLGSNSAPHTPFSRTPRGPAPAGDDAMTKLTNISEEASLVLVSELITQLERQREANGQPSLVKAMQAAIGQTWIDNPEAAPGLRVGMADAQLVLEWVKRRLSPDEDLHFGDLVAEAPGSEG